MVYSSFKQFFLACSCFSSAVAMYTSGLRQELRLYKCLLRTERSVLFNICLMAFGHLMKFTQRSIPYRLGLALSTAFYTLGLSSAFTD